MAVLGVNSRMKLSDKVWIVLEETRILILGPRSCSASAFAGCSVPGRQRPRHGRDPAARFGTGGRYLRRNRENLRLFRHRVIYRWARFRAADWPLVPIPDHCGAPRQV